MSELSVVIIFDRISLVPVAILPNGCTDEETARLREVVDRMREAIKEGPAQNLTRV